VGQIDPGVPGTGGVSKSSHPTGQPVAPSWHTSCSPARGPASHYETQVCKIFCTIDFFAYYHDTNVIP